MSFRIWDKVKITSRNENEEGKDFLMYTTIQGIADDIKGTPKYIVGGSWVKTKLLSKCTKKEIEQFYN